MIDFIEIIDSTISTIFPPTLPGAKDAATVKMARFLVEMLAMKCQTYHLHISDAQPELPQRFQIEIDHVVLYGDVSKTLLLEFYS